MNKLVILFLAMVPALSGAELPPPVKPTATQLRGAAVAALWTWALDAQMRDVAQRDEIAGLRAQVAGIDRIEANVSRLTAAVAPAVTPPKAAGLFKLGTSLRVAVDLTPNGPALSRVEYFVAGAKIGEATAAPWAIDWKPASAGSYTIAVRATPVSGLPEDGPASLVEILP